jgi:hypothetical protein
MLTLPINLQQRVLLRIYTGFPFKYSIERSIPVNSAKVQFFSGTPAKIDTRVELDTALDECQICLLLFNIFLFKIIFICVKFSFL